MSQLITIDYVSGNIHKRSRRKCPLARDQDGPHNYSEREQAMWRAVIMQAMIDAGTSSHKLSHGYYKKKALKWLTGDSDDFTDVCERAGFEAHRVRRQAKKALLNPSLWHVEPGMSDRYEERRAMRERQKRREEDTPPQSCILYFTTLREAL